MTQGLGSDDEERCDGCDESGIKQCEYCGELLCADCRQCHQEREAPTPRPKPTEDTWAGIADVAMLACDNVDATLPEFLGGLAMVISKLEERKFQSETRLARWNAEYRR